MSCTFNTIMWHCGTFLLSNITITDNRHQSMNKDLNSCARIYHGIGEVRAIKQLLVKTCAWPIEKFGMASRRAVDLSCNIAWSHTIGTPENKRDLKRLILPTQHSWASNSDPLNGTPVDVRLYVRGGTWVEQFASKLVGESGGNRHLSSIYISGELRERGEAEFKKKLEAKGLSLPSGFHCDEWVLFQRQGNVIIIKLEYSKPLLLEEIRVFQETTLTDKNVWWSLPVLVNTGNEPVFGRSVKPGIYSPAIEGQEVAFGIANRGSETVAVMPYIDGHQILKAP